MQLLLQQFRNEFKMYEETINASKSNKHREQNKELLHTIEIIIEELQRINKE
jgi:hypothetical protein